MASEDVIELGSSEDEAEPKKVCSKKLKPSQNVMVHIPGKFDGVTVTKKSARVPSGSAITVKTVNSNATSIGSAITVKKVGNFNAKNTVKSNGKPLRPVVVSAASSAPKQGKSTVNPLNIIRKFKNGQVNINKVSPSNVLLKNISKPMRPIKILPVTKPLTVLPPNITVKKTLSGPQTSMGSNVSNATRIPSGAKRPAGSAQKKTFPSKKRKLNPAFVPKDVLTVELDDDEAPPPSTPWYIRPEEHSEQLKMKEKNDSEPKTTQFDEIVIEDSPVKPIKDKRMCEIEVDIPITIEDSPAKGTNTKQHKHETIASDEDEVIGRTGEPQSKKKLEYPRQSSIEIEIFPMEVDVTPSTDVVHVIENQKEEETDLEIVHIVKQDSKIKSSENQPSEAAKQSSSMNTECGQEISEFHPVYQSFIDLCFKLENSEDMKKIVEKKIKAYYKQVSKEYTESEQFIDLVQSKISLIKASPEKMYLYIKDVVDELNLQRKMTKSQTATNNSADKKEVESFLYGEESEFDSKRQRQIRKLEKTLKKLHRAIQKLEEQEVDFDDEEDSVYLLTERYKERMVRVHAKFCQLTNTKMPSEPRVVIDARPGQPTGPAKRLEKYINKKVPIGTPLPFPDFHDVLRCVREANEEDRLGWNEADIMEEARDLFTRCGKKLQRRRQENEWRLAASRITNDILDPAEDNETLKKKLDENRQVATKKEAEVFNKFADRQCQLKLEAEEIGDKEAEESPVESEEDEPENSELGDKERRKERLKRLIQEKSVKKVNTDKPDNDAGQNETEIKTTDVKEPSEPVENLVSDNVTKDDSTENGNVTIEIVGDGSDNIGSDIDELHLLQKLHSENEINSSTLESTDTDTPIDISDTLESGDNKGKSDDVISIENSSYSEAEEESIETHILPDDSHVKTQNNEIKVISISTENKICHQNEKSPLAVELCDNSSSELCEKNEHDNNKREESVELAMGLSEEDNCQQNYPKANEEQKESSKCSEESDVQIIVNPPSIELCDNLSVESNETLKLNNPVKSSENSSAETAETLELKNPLRVDSVQILRNSENFAEKSQILSEEESCEQNDKSPSLVELCENSSTESDDVKNSIFNEHKHSANKKEENPGTIELDDTSSVDSGESKKDEHDKQEQFVKNAQALTYNDVFEQKKNLPSVEICESSSVEICKYTSPLTKTSADDIVDCKNNESDNETKQASVLKEVTKTFNLVENKTYNVVVQSNDIQEIEIAHSPPENFNGKQEYIDKETPARESGPNVENKHSALDNKLSETNENSNNNCMDVDEHDSVVCS